jgi:hypothetical protein
VIDWNAVVLGPVMGVFGQQVLYQPANGTPFTIFHGVFDNGFVEVDPIGSPGVLSAKPVLGIQLSEFPAGFDAKEAQGDFFTMLSTGVTYIVKGGEADSHGHALLRANVAPVVTP